MENASKALVMVANMLLAVIILSLVLYFYNRLRTLPIEEDLNTAIEQAQEFNKQYEVYDKRIMYGVDVISALNKAISNNEKYIQGKWLSGSLSTSEFAIDIVVVLDDKLKEEVEVTYRAEDISGDASLTSNSNRTYAYTTNEGVISVSFEDLYKNRVSITPNFRIPSGKYIDLYTSFSDWNQIKLVTQEIETKYELSDDMNVIKDGGDRYVYHLLPGENDKKRFSKEAIAKDDLFLKYLIDGLTAFTSSSGQTIYNRETTDGATTRNFSDSSRNGWSSMTWTPAITDLKTRKFKCVGVDENGIPNGEPGIEYNETTGAINKITFVEYGIN